MRNLLLFILLSLNSCIEANSQILDFRTEVNGTNAIAIPSGEKWKIMSYAATNYIEVYASTNRIRRLYYIEATGNEAIKAESSGYPVGAVLVGPAYLYPGGQYYICFQKIQDVSTNPALSATAVVIPTSATGDVDVKMEQSADNVTWTECLPGTYNSSTVKRFFRLRAVEK